MTLTDPHTYIHTVARKSGSNFTLSFFSLPKDQREAMTAVYAFCREVDDAVDDPGQKDPAAEVARWRMEIDQTYAGKPTGPLTRSLAESIQRFSLSREYFDGILTGVEMDLKRSRYETFEALSEYCYHVAGEVGLLCMEIFGYRSERMKDYAVKLGMAFQLTNILRDVGPDADNKRIYLPLEDLRRFGVSEEWIFAQASPPAPLPTGEGSENPSPVGRGRRSTGEAAAFIRLMAFEAHRAWGYYRDAAVLPTPEERPALRAAEIMRAVYSNVLERIEKKNYQVFGPRVRVPKPVKVWLAAKAWWGCR